MRPYGFKPDKRIELPGHYFTEADGLVKESCSQIMDLCIPVFQARIPTKCAKKKVLITSAITVALWMIIAKGYHWLLHRDL